MGGWLIGLSECNPAQFWVELFMMWQSGGIRKHLVYGSVGLNSVIREKGESPTLRCWKGDFHSDHEGRENCWEITISLMDQPPRPSTAVALWTFVSLWLTGRVP